MTDTSGFFETASRDVPRDQWGRYKLPDADGSTSGWTRATTFAEALTEQFGLTIWKQRQVAYGLGKRPDLLALASTIAGPEDKQALQGIVDGAHAAAATDFKANMGTAVHQACALAERSPALYTSRLAAVDGVPVEFRDHVLGYLSAMDSAGFRIDPRYVERTVIVPEFHVAGTLDNAVLCPDGKYRIADKKTGNLDYAAIEFAVQLALYANAKAMRNYETNSYEPMPPNLATDYAIIAHIDVDTKLTTLYRVNIRQGWAWARLCAEVRDARQTKHVLTPLVSEIGMGAPEYAVSIDPASVLIDGRLVTPAQAEVALRLPPSPIQQSTVSTPDSFWDLPHDEDDELPADWNQLGAVASPPFTPPASAAAPVSASAAPPVSSPATAAAAPPDLTAVVPASADADLGAQSLTVSEEEIAELAEAIKTGTKTKAKLQGVAREVMAEASKRSGTQITETSPDGIKLSQYTIKIATGVVRLSLKWGIPLPTFDKPAKATKEAPPVQTEEERNALLRLKMVRHAPTKQALLEFRDRLTPLGQWTDDFTNAARTRFEELEVIERAAGGVPIPPEELIAGATSPDTLQIAWRRATDEGKNPDGWTEELKNAATAKAAELSAAS